MTSPKANAALYNARMVKEKEKVEVAWHILATKNHGDSEEAQDPSPWASQNCPEKEHDRTIMAAHEALETGNAIAAKELSGKSKGLTEMSGERQETGRNTYKGETEGSTLAAQCQQEEEGESRPKSEPMGKRPVEGPYADLLQYGRRNEGKGRRGNLGSIQEGRNACHICMQERSTDQCIQSGKMHGGWR